MYMYKCVYKSEHAHVYVCTHMNACTCVCTHFGCCMYVCTHMSVHEYVGVYVYIGMCLCVCVYEIYLPFFVENYFSVHRRDRMCR